MVFQIVGSILHGGPIERFLVPISADSGMWSLVYGDSAYKRSHAANRKEGIRSRYGPLPHIQRHITVN